MIDHQLALELPTFIQGQYEILSLSGSYIRGEHGGKTGGLSVCLSSSDGQIFGGGVGGLLKAAGPVQVSFLLSYSLTLHVNVEFHTLLPTKNEFRTMEFLDHLSSLWFWLWFPLQVILGTFQLERKKDGRNGVKGGDDASGSGNMLPSPPATESLIGFHSGMESSGRNPNDEHHSMTSNALGGGAHFMMQPHQGMHMTHARPSEWGGSGYDLSGK